jgi:small subunit ribosomal protein S20
MANIKSAKKRIRQTLKRTEMNRARVSRVRNFVRKAEEAIGSGDKQQAQDSFKIAQSEIMRGVSKGVVHLKTASRKISRLNARVKAL